MKTKQKDNQNSKPKTTVCQVAWDSKSIQKNADGQMTIQGFANTKDKDRVGDIVLPSAFKNTMKEYMKNPVLLYQHDWDNVIGHITDFDIVDDDKADKQGIFIKAVLSNAKDVDDVRTKIKEGSLKTFSIGYNELDTDYDRETDTQIVKELELLEISVVTIPANPFASFSAEMAEGKGIVDSNLLKFISEAVAGLKSAEEATPEFLKEVIEIYNETQETKQE